MQFVQLKHQIGEEKPKPEKKVLSNDIAYPLVSYFTNPKRSEIFVWNEEKQEMYPFMKGAEGVDFLVSYDHDERNYATEMYEKARKVEEEISPWHRAMCEAFDLTVQVTAFRGNTEDIERMEIPYFRCFTRVARKTDIPERDLPHYREDYRNHGKKIAEELNSTELSRKYLFLPLIHENKYLESGFFAIPRDTIERFRKFMKDMEAKALGRR